MSQLPVTMGVNVKLGAVLGQVALLPPALQGALRGEIWNGLSHHRRSVIKRAGQFPAGRNAQKAIASRTRRFTKAPSQDGTVATVYGEGFAASVRNDPFGDKAITLLEQGGTASSNEMMAVPIAEGLKMTRSPIAGRRQLYRDLIAQRKLRLVIRPGMDSLLVQDVAGRGKTQRGAKSNIMAVLVRGRRQPRLLGYMAEWQNAQAFLLARLEKALDTAATEAGRSTLLEKAERARVGQQVYSQVFRDALSANPRKWAEARKVAESARRKSREVPT